MNEDIKFGPKLGGTTEVYKQLRDAGAQFAGTRVEITIPGVPRPFVTESLGGDEDWSSGQIMLGDQKYFLGDMSNGYLNHNWTIRVEVKSQPKPWHDAKRGEIWVVERVNLFGFGATTTPRSVSRRQYDEARFVDPDSNYPSFPVTDESIINAFRIWPVDA